MNYRESVEYIHSLLAFGIKPGLERMNMLLELLDNPQNKIKTIHIAGTNGKGSTSTMLSNIIKASGAKTGLFTSPFVISFCERIQINGKNIDENTFSSVCTRVREKIEMLNSQGIIITEFEAITATAFLCFYECGCEYAVIEVGLGGRFDATNTIIKPQCVIITSISLDHTKILGDTIEKIAFEKCGIIKNGSQVFTSRNQHKDAVSVIEKTVCEKGGSLIYSNPEKAKILTEDIYGTSILYDGHKYFISLAGGHQIENALNVIGAAIYLGMSYENIYNGIKNTKMLARMEIINENPLIIRDGGHNEGCSIALKNYILKNNIENIRCVIGMMADKDTEVYLKNVASLCDELVLTTPTNPRSMDCMELCEKAKKYCDRCVCIQDPKKAYDYAVENTEKNNTVLVCGSFYLMSDIFGS